MQNSDALQFTEIKMYSYYRKAQQRQKERNKPVSGTRDAEVTNEVTATRTGLVNLVLSDDRRTGFFLMRASVY